MTNRITLGLCLSIYIIVAFLLPNRLYSIKKETLEIKSGVMALCNIEQRRFASENGYDLPIDCRTLKPL